MFALTLPVWFIAHYYVGWRLISTTSLSRRARRVLWALLAVQSAIVPLAMSIRRGVVVPDALARPLNLLVYITMGAFVFLLLGTLAREVVLIIDALWRKLRPPESDPAPPRVDPSPRVSRRQLLLNSTSAATALGVVGVTGRGYYNATRIPEIKRVEVKIAALHPDLEGFQIVQISDVHVGNTIGKAFLDAVIDRVEALNPDLIAITGDMVDGYPDRLRASMAGLKRLSAPAGVFYVTGNHEYYWDGPAWLDEVEALGVTTLPNAHRVVRHRGATLVVAGVNDYSAARRVEGHASSVKRAIEGAPASADLRLLLAHQPNSVLEARELGFDLQLSGHTHGGQFFPINFIVGRVHPFSKGLSEVVPGMQIYVSCGTGYWGPPLRLLAPSEITLLTLTRA